MQIDQRDTLFDRLDQAAAFLAAHHCDAKAIDDVKAEIVRLRGALQKIAAGTTVHLESGETWPSPLGAKHSQQIATTALEQKP